MKEIVLTAPPSSVVHIRDINDNKYYGVTMPDGTRGIVTRRRPGVGLFAIYAVEGFTHANGWRDYDNANLEVLIRRVIENGGIAFEFDTFLDLAKWVSDCV